MTDQRKDVKYKAGAGARPSREGEAASPKAHELTCPSCGHGNAASAKFCADCGKSLLAPATCPECSAAILPGADICEACGTWLLQGQCMFCSAPVGKGQAHCGSCGNPTTGIPCPQCGKLSFFDFCKTCAVPLSNEAHALAGAAASDPDHQKLAALLEELHAFRPDAQAASAVTTVDPHSTTQDVHDDQVRKMKLARAALSAPETPRYQRGAPKVLFSNEQKKQISLLAEQVAQEQERLRLEEERRRQEQERIRQEAERQRLAEQEQLRRVQAQINQEMSKFHGKTFSSNQEARRFFMNLMSGLPEEVARSITTTGLAWRCNAYDCEHASPAECADPSRGGVWLIR